MVRNSPNLAWVLLLFKSAMDVPLLDRFSAERIGGLDRCQFLLAKGSPVEWQFDRTVLEHLVKHDPPGLPVAQLRTPTSRHGPVR